MQPIQNATPRPIGEHTPSARLPVELPLSSVQQTVLERLIIRITALNQQQSAEIWAGLKHDLKLKGEYPLLSQHFSAAEKNLNIRLTQAQNNLVTRQVIHQLTTLLPLGNNRQIASDFMQQQFGQTALSQLTQIQLKTVLTLLQNTPSSSALPSQQSPQTSNTLVADHLMQPIDQNTLNLLVNRLATTTGEPAQKIWQHLLTIVNIKLGEPIPARLFTPLSHWLQAHNMLSQHPSPTLETLQIALKQPLTESEREWVTDYSLQRFQATPLTPLTSFQVQDILTQILLMHSDRQSGPPELRDIKPITRLFASEITSIKNINSYNQRIIIVLLVTIAVLWIIL